MADNFSRRRFAMTGKQLKNSILQWAIQGKLVPQDPNDEPASVLLEKIRAEKARLVKEGKIKKDKKESIIYRGDDNSYYEKFADGKVVCIDDELPYSLPLGWTWCRLNELGIYRKGPFGSSLTKSMFVPKSEHSIKVYEQKNAIQKDYRLGEYYISEDKFAEMQSFVTKPFDIIVSCAGTIGETYLLPEEAPIGIINQALMRVELYNLGIADYWQLFFAYILLIENEMKGAGSAIKNIPPFEYLKAILVPIPPIQEQKRIIEKYNELTKLICQYTQQKEVLDLLNDNLYPSIKKSILQEASQGKLVPQDPSDEPASVLLEKIRAEKAKLVKEGKMKKKDLVESTIFRGDDNKYYEQIGQESIEITEDIPFEIPTSWEWCRLRDLCLIFTGATFRKDEAKTDSKGVRILRGGNILPFEIVQKMDDIFLSQEQVKESILLKQNDIITPAVTSLENIGKMARVAQDMPNITVGGFVFVLRPHYSDEWLSKFLLFFMSSPSAIEFMKSITNKSGQAFYNIGKERLAMTLVPIPPKDEERRIVVKIEDLFDRIKG